MMTRKEDVGKVEKDFGSRKTMMLTMRMMNGVSGRVMYEGRSVCGFGVRAVRARWNWMVDEVVFESTRSKIRRDRRDSMESGHLLKKFGMLRELYHSSISGVGIPYRV
jgi:hypothetical protein